MSDYKLPPKNKPQPPLGVPDGYFATLDERLIKQAQSAEPTAAPRAKVVRFTPILPWLAGATAAAALWFGVAILQPAPVTDLANLPQPQLPAELVDSFWDELTTDIYGQDLLAASTEDLALLAPDAAIEAEHLSLEELEHYYEIDFNDLEILY
jgi:hypothetical protein